MLPNAVILSALPDHCRNYVDVSKKEDLPIPLNSLYNPTASTLEYSELLDRARETSITVTEVMASNVERCTRGQCHSEKWFMFRAGRVTASNMKAVCATDPLNPSLSLLKKICYPTQFSIQTEATK